MKRSATGIVAACALLATACGALVGIVDVTTTGGADDGGKGDVGSVGRTDGGAHDARHEDSARDVMTKGDADTGVDGNGKAGDDSSGADDTGVGPGDDSGGGNDDASRVDYGAGDRGDACVPPEGGPRCAPEQIACSGLMCHAPADECCLDSGGQGFCQADSAGCSGLAIQCLEAADCPTLGAICCASLTTQTTGLLSCHVGPTCPEGAELYAQICESDNECASKACDGYTCGPLLLQACGGTLRGPLEGSCAQ